MRRIEMKFPTDEEKIELALLITESYDPDKLVPVLSAMDIMEDRMKEGLTGKGTLTAEQTVAKWVKIIEPFKNVN